MVNILVVTHGAFAKGICHSAQMILGEQSNLASYEFQPNQSLDSLVNGLKESIDAFQNKEEILILVDLFGGSPSNAVALLLSEGYQLHAISGVNLPMLLEVLGGREFLDLTTLVEVAQNTAREGIVDICVKLLEN